MSGQDRINSRISELLDSHQKQLDMAREHLSVLYTSQNFLVEVLISASPELKAYFGTRLRQALADAEQMECNPHLLETLREWETRTRTQAVLTPQQRRAQLRLVKTPKPDQPE